MPKHEQVLFSHVNKHERLLFWTVLSIILVHVYLMRILKV